MIQQLQKWLKNPNASFEEGYELLKMVCSNAALVFSVGQAQTRHNRQRMVDFFEGYILEHSDTKKPQTVAEKAESVPEVVLTVPEQLRAIMVEAFKRANFLKLRHLNSDDIETRRKAAKEILELFKYKINPIKQQLKEYETTGKLPEKHYLTREVPAAATIQERMQSILNLRSRISRHKDNSARQADIIKWRAEIASIQQEIDALQSQ